MRKELSNYRYKMREEEALAESCMEEEAMVETDLRLISLFFCQINCILLLLPLKGQCTFRVRGSLRNYFLLFLLIKFVIMTIIMRIKKHHSNNCRFYDL